MAAINSRCPPPRLQALMFRAMKDKSFSIHEHKYESVADKEFMVRFFNGVHAMTHKKTVKEWNEVKLATLPAAALTFNSIDSFNNCTTEKKAAFTTEMESSKNVQRTVVLKNGCRVMLTQSLKGSKIAAGKFGTVVRCDKVFMKAPEVMVLFDGMSDPVSIPIVDFTCESDDSVMHRKQIPLVLGYAITIHKLQGTELTDSDLFVHLDNAFSHGQILVALSRHRKPFSKLFIVGHPISWRNVQSLHDKRVQSFYRQQDDREPPLLLSTLPKHKYDWPTSEELDQLQQRKDAVLIDNVRAGIVAQKPPVVIDLVNNVLPRLATPPPVLPPPLMPLVPPPLLPSALPAPPPSVPPPLFFSHRDAIFHYDLCQDRAASNCLDGTAQFHDGRTPTPPFRPFDVQYANPLTNRYTGITRTILTPTSDDEARNVPSPTSEDEAILSSDDEARNVPSPTSEDEAILYE